MSDETHLWHLLKHDLDYITYDRELHDWVPAPNKQTLNFDADTNEMSAKWREHLDGHGWTPADVLDAAKTDYALVFEAPTVTVRGILADGQYLEVRHTPTGSKPDACAHSSVYWPASLSDADKSRTAKDKRRNVRVALGHENLEILWRDRFPATAVARRLLP